MNPRYSAVIAGPFFLVIGCEDNSGFNPGPPAGRFRVDSAQVDVHSERATFQFTFHFEGRPGSCSSFHFDVANSEKIIAGGPSPGFSPYPVDSLIHLSDTLSLFYHATTGDSVLALYQFRGEFWEVVGSQRVTYGQFAFRDSIRLRVPP